MSDIPFSVEVHTAYQEKTLSAFRKVIEDKQLYYFIQGCFTCILLFRRLIGIV